MRRKFVVFFIGLFFLFPMCVNAEGITNYYINSTLQSNGDLEVEEYFYLSGSFNGMERVINFKNNEAYSFDASSESYGGSVLHNGDGITINGVKAMDIDSDYDFSNKSGKKFKKVSTASKGSYGVYTVSKTSDGDKVKIFLPSSKKKAFYIRYTLHNMAIYHNDVGEIGWNIVGNSLSEDIDNLVGYVNLTNNSETLRAWAHGPLNGNISLVSKDKVKIDIKNLSRYKSIDVRCVFDNSIIPNSSKKTNIDALDKILLYEEDEAQKANYERDKKQEEYENDVIEAINTLKNTPDRYYYNKAIEKANYLTDKTKKENYIFQIKEIEPLVIEEEINSATRKLEFTENYPDYDSYKSAKEKVEALQDGDLKTSYLKRLVLLKELVKKNESKTNKKFANFNIILILISIIIYIIYYLKNIKEFGDKFNKEYLREFPSDISPAELGLLYHKKITGKEISATILDLILRGVITYKKKNKKEYILTLVDDNNLSEIENRFVVFLFHNKKTVNTKDFKKSSYQYKNSLSTKYDNFKEKVKNGLVSKNLIIKDESLKNTTNYLSNFFGVFILSFTVPCVGIFVFFLYTIYLLLNKKVGVKEKIVILNTIFIIINLISLVILLILNHYVRDSYIINLIGIVIFIVIMRISKVKLKRTAAGVLEVSKWMAMKRFFNDFSNFQEEEIEKVKIWDKYLVYATVLGCSKKLAKIMNAEIKDFDGEIYSSLMLINNYNDFDNLTRNIDTTVSNKSYTSTSTSTGSYSSSDGFGGGFSGGSSDGGSFGGGGGGGRF